MYRELLYSFNFGKQPRHSSWFNTTQHLINDHLELVIVAWNRGRESVLQTLQPTARKLWADMQMGGKARLLGNAANGHSTMGLKHPQRHPLSIIRPFFEPLTIQEDRKDKWQVLGLILLVRSCKLEVFHDARPASGSARAALSHRNT